MTNTDNTPGNSNGNSNITEPARGNQFSNPELEPASHDAETLLLGILLRDSETLEFLDWLLPEYFYYPQHAEIYRIILDLYQQGREFSYWIINELTKQNEIIVRFGGSKYLSGIFAALAPRKSATQFAEVIYDRYLRRQAVATCKEHIARLQDLDTLSASADIESLEMSLFNLAEKHESFAETRSLHTSAGHAIELIEQSYRRNMKLTGVTTGLQDVDDALSGLHKSDLLIVAGRPGMGKTAFATTVAMNAALSWKEYENDKGMTIEEGAHVLYFSLEMSSEQLAARILSQRSAVRGTNLRSANLSDNDLGKLVKAAQGIHTTPLFIDDTPGVTMQQLLQRARRFKRINKGKLGLIIVDYLQLIRPDSKKSYSQKVHEVTDISRDLKLMARELEIPVIALSQLSREVERRADKRPMLADLRESGAIEQDADVVMFLYREEYYLRRQPPVQELSESLEELQKRQATYEDRLERSLDRAELIIAKYRHGPITDIVLRFDSEYATFQTSTEHQAVIT